MLPVLALVSCVAVARPSSPPNVVFIYADDLGYGDTSVYGAKAVHTPNIDRLASQGLRFTDAYSSSSTCTPSRYSVMTGRYAFRQRGTAVLPGNAALIVPLNHTSLPQVFKRAGYATGIVGKWHLGLGTNRDQDWNREITPGPREVGFDYSFIMAATGDRVPCVYLENDKVVGLVAGDPIQVSYTKPFVGEVLGSDEEDYLKMKPSYGHNQAVVNGIPRIGYMVGGTKALWKDEDRADIFAAKGVDFIRKNAHHPFFLYFAPHDIHVPRVPQARFVGKTKMGPRGDVIVELDWTVGAILHALDRFHLAANTLVILSSDNGPVIDDGYRDRAKELLGSHKPAGPFRGGKYSIFEGGTRMPFIVRWPGHVEPGVSHAIVSQVDFISSFADLVGQNLAPDDAPDSFDELAALLGHNGAGRASCVEYADALALREGRWKYIRPSNTPAFDPMTETEMGTSKAPQLYDIADDPAERQNIASEHPELVDKLAADLDALVKAGRSRP